MLDFLNLDGPLGSRASLMMDIVFVAMFAVIPVMAWSIYQVKFNRRYLLHKRVQLTLGLILAITVTLFEIHVNIHDWKFRSTGQQGAAIGSGLMTMLVVHLCFSIPTALLWIFVIVQALRKIPNPPGPSDYSRKHKFWARIAALEMFMTALTGWCFYLMAFVF